MSQSPVIVWFRDDLRLADQAALHEAGKTGRTIIPAFILDQEAGGGWAPGAATLWWLHHSLAALGRSLKERGTGLVLRRGSSADQIATLVEATGATDVFTGGSANPFARRIDRDAAEALVKLGCKLHRMRTTTLFHPDAVKTKTGNPYMVYTPFANACLALGRPKNILSTPDEISAGRLPDSDRLEDWGLLPINPDWAKGFDASWTPGEDGAQQRAEAFLRDGLPGYAAARNRPAGDGTSMLSPHLHFGEISAAALWHMADRRPASGSREMLIREVLWREFNHSLLWHHPELPDEPLRAEFARMPWRDDPKGLRAWQRGRTGVPIVDAGMRQLWQTGWMHNRVRMIVASFLIKHLMIPWQVGEAWFWDTLVDADLANNAGNWQWVAGCGADAAPYFRIFNPVLQGRKFDPAGDYVRRFVPELRRLDAKYIHAPWDAPDGALDAAGIRLEDNYPKPLVDLAMGRERALAAYGQIRNAA